MNINSFDAQFYNVGERDQPNGGDQANVVPTSLQVNSSWYSQFTFGISVPFSFYPIALKAYDIASRFALKSNIAVSAISYGSELSDLYSQNSQATTGDYIKVGVDGTLFTASACLTIACLFSLEIPGVNIIAGGILLFQVANAAGVFDPIYNSFNK